MKKLGFGLMRLPLTAQEDATSIDQPQLERMVDHFISQGFTYFDTAYPYHQGLSEAAARKALVQRYPRKAFLLADKMPVWLVKDPGDYQRFFDEQLQRCGVDYFDYYLLHTMGEQNYATTLKYGGFSFMKKLKAEGRAKHIGMSFHDKADVLDRILTEHPELEFVQLQINYIDWEDETIQAHACYDVAVKHGKPVIVMEPVKGGSLANLPPAAHQLLQAYRPGQSAASWAVRYAASLEHVFMVLSGMSDLTQLEDNTACMKDFEPLSAGEREVLDRAAGLITSSIDIPCTACRYCVDGCPKHIPIPDYFALYNNQKLFGLRPMHKNHYNNLTETLGRAGECIGCGQCESHCPQHIEIIKQLAKVAEVFEG